VTPETSGGLLEASKVTLEASDGPLEPSKVTLETFGSRRNLPT
jgi:hypothetical protein